MCGMHRPDAAVAPTERWWSWVANLFPGYFALVMATGIIAAAAFLLHVAWLAYAFLCPTIAAYLVFLALYVTRLIRFPGRFMGDLTSHARGPAFLTVVGGTNVLGADLLIIPGWRGAALVLWGLGIVLWLALMYTFVGAIVVRSPKPNLATGFNGGWMILVIGTESIAVLGALLGPGLASPAIVMFVALCACMVGMLLYLILIGLICYRWWFITTASEPSPPPYWINTGGLAITSLACMDLFITRSASPLVTMIAPFLVGMAVLFWAAATWWIPLLVSLGVWRHAIQRVPLQYEPQYWTLVFTLGIYGVATFRLAEGLELSFLTTIPRVFLVAAILAWAWSAAGMTFDLIRRPTAGAVDMVASPNP
jgi:tellurite resistance protein TehA-like permease